MGLNTKYCSTCSKEKTTSLFYKNRAKTDGYCNECKACYGQRMRSYGDKPKIRKAEWHKTYYAKNRNRLREYSKVYYERNRRRIAERERKRAPIRRAHTYGITEERLRLMFKQQKGKCKICKCPGTLRLRGPRKNEQRVCKILGIDHNHTNGKVRGLLCTCCNSALGKFRESEKVLQAAIRYLKRHK